MKNTASQVLMARWASAATYGLVLLSVAIFCYSREATPLIVAGAACVVSWIFLEIPKGGWLVPRWVINVVLLGAAVKLCYDVTSRFANDSIILSLGQFIIAILLCKLFEHRTRRGVIDILILTLLVVVSGTMFSSSSFVYAVMLAAYLAVLVYTIVLFNLHLETEKAGGQENLPAVFPSNGQVGLLSRDLRKVAWRCLLGLAPVALVIFLMMPRATAASLASSWGAGSYQTGFTDSVQLHDFGQLAESDVEVMHVTFSRMRDGVQENMGSEFLDPYFRGQVLDTYSPEDHRWYHSNALEMDPDFYVTQQKNMTADGVKLSEKPYLNYEEQTYFVYLPSGRALYTSGMPIWIGSNHISNVMMNNRDMTLRYTGRGRNQEYTLRSTEEMNSQAYAEYPETPRAVGELRAARDKGPFERGPARKEAVMVPEPIVNLALRILPEEMRPAAGQRVAPEKIRAVMAEFEGYLKSNYAYSLSFAQVDSSLDPTTDFLLNRKQAGGHCEFFASAMVMLCRAVGINSRMVTGYHGGEYNSFGKYYTVRQKDAHAWTEAFVPGTGWVTSDPTPSRGNGEGAGFSVVRWARELGQILQNAWLAAVVSFDSQSQQVVMAWIDARLQAVRELMDDVYAALRDSVSGRSSLGVGARLSFLGPFAGLIAVSGWSWRKWREDRRRARASNKGAMRRAGRLSGEAAFLDDLLRMLGRLSPRRPDLTPREFAELLPLGPMAADADWLIETAYGLRYGAVVATPELRGQIAVAMRRIRSGLK